MSLAVGIRTKIQDSFANQSMMTTFGATLHELSNGIAVLKAPVAEHCQQQHGFGHAALTFGLGDSAAGYAALSVMPVEMEVLTSEMQIHLLAPAKGDYLLARGRVVKAGRRLVVVQSEVYALTEGREKQIALLTGTMIPIAQ